MATAAPATPPAPVPETKEQMLSRLWRSISSDLLYTGEGTYANDPRELQELYLQVPEAERAAFVEQYSMPSSHENSDDWNTALLAACLGGRVNIVKWLVEVAKANIHAVNKKGTTPVLAACFGANRSRVEAVQFLVSRGADFRARQNGENGVLHLAAVFGNTAILQFGITELRLPLEAENDAMYTPLCLACGTDSLETVQYLVDIAGADIEHVNNLGARPLHMALFAEKVELAKFLLTRGADRNAQTTKKIAAWSIGNIFDSARAGMNAADIAKFKKLKDMHSQLLNPASFPLVQVRRPAAAPQIPQAAAAPSPYAALPAVGSAPSWTPPAPGAPAHPAGFPGHYPSVPVASVVPAYGAYQYAPAGYGLPQYTPPMPTYHPYASSAPHGGSHLPPAAGYSGYPPAAYHVPGAPYAAPHHSQYAQMPPGAQPAAAPYYQQAPPVGYGQATQYQPVPSQGPAATTHTTTAAPVTTSSSAPTPTAAPAPAASSSEPASGVVAVELDAADFEFGQKLGSGAYGEVFKGTWRGIPVAIKKLIPSEGKSAEEATAEFQKELRMMQETGNHPNVLTLYGIFLHEQKMCIVMQFMDKGDLATLLKRRPKAFDLVTLAGMAAQIAAGLAHLHSRRIVHRDLAARNILVDRDNCARVADFGYARTLGRHVAKGSTVQAVGPLRWMAPESLSKAKEYSNASDVWSFGTIMFEMLTGGQEPWEDEEQHHAAAHTIHGELPLHQLPPDVFPAWQSILVSCWSKEPAARPSMKDLQIQLTYLQKKLQQRAAQPQSPTPQTPSAYDAFE